MEKIIKRVLYVILFLVGAICITGLVLAYWPTAWKIKNKGITPEEASVLRQHYAGLHNRLPRVMVKRFFCGVVLIGVGDKDELFEIDKVKEFLQFNTGQQKGIFYYEKCHPCQNTC